MSVPGPLRSIRDSALCSAVGSSGDASEVTKRRRKQHLPGDEAWLIGEHRTSGEKKYYLANLSATTDLRTLAATIKARWVCEQAHQQLKEELGLDHFEGRSWRLGSEGTGQRVRLRSGRGSCSAAIARRGHRERARTFSVGALSSAHGKTRRSRSALRRGEPAASGVVDDLASIGAEGRKRPRHRAGILGSVDVRDDNA